jgi:hypothetical protein
MIWLQKTCWMSVEESRLTGEVNRALNSTFIALIPKVNGPATFEEFRLIALCNLCYKIFSKIIARRIRPILSRALSEEQFGFLKGRQIIRRHRDDAGMSAQYQRKKASSLNPKDRFEEIL